MTALHDIVKKDSTNRSVTLRIIDSSDGTPETGVVFNTSGIDLWYRRESAARVAITEVTLAALTTAHTDGGFLHISDGAYRLDIPDAAFATGVNHVDFGGTVTGMVVIGGRVRLVDYDLEDGVRLGLTALPNAAAEAAGGLYTRGTGAGQINQDANGRADANIAATNDIGLSATQKTDVNIEADNAIVTYKLDHLLFVADGDDPVDGSVIAHLASATEDWSTFVPSTDSLQAISDDLSNTTDGLGAIKDSIDGIGAGSGGALNFANEADNIGADIKSIAFDGVETSGTNASVNSEDGTYHVIDDSSNNIDIVYQFDIGGGRTAVEVTWKGFLSGSNDEATLQAYNGSSFDTLFTISGKAGSTNDTHVIPLLSTHTGTGSDIGKVFIRLECAAQSNPTLNTDQLIVSAVNIGQTIGYDNASVWVDTDDGTAGTESFVNGVGDNPVLTLADAITIASNTGLHRFQITPESAITFAETHINEVWAGDGWTLALGGQDCGGTHFMGADVSGIATGSVEIHFDHCEIGTCTLAAAHLDDCDLEGTITLSSAGGYIFAYCIHKGTPVIDFGAAVGVSTTVHVHGYEGALTIKNMGQSGTDILHFSSAGGKLTLDSTNIGGTVNMNGTFDFVNNGSGQTINKDGAVIETVDAIKTVTNKFVFTKANEVDANTKSINDAEVVGDGNATPWDGA